MSDDRDAMNTGADTDSDSQMLQCVECGQFFAARGDSDDLIPFTGGNGDCSNCGSDEFQRVTLDSDSN